SELAGFPVTTHTQLQAVNHGAAPGVAALMPLTPPREQPRAVAVADLDGDGIPELITSAGVHVYVWETDGSLRAHFPVSMDLENCKADHQKQGTDGEKGAVHRKCGFIGSVALGHLEGADHALDIVVAGLDGHLYGWRGNGTTLPGFP